MEGGSGGVRERTLPSIVHRDTSTNRVGARLLLVDIGTYR